MNNDTAPREASSHRRATGGGKTTLAGVKMVKEQGTVYYQTDSAVGDGDEFGRKGGTQSTGQHPTPEQCTPHRHPVHEHGNENGHEHEQEHEHEDEHGLPSRHPPMKQERPMSSLPSYPFLDTFSLLCILMVFPHWISTISLILYVFLGHPDFFDTMFSFFLKHKLNRNPNSGSSPVSTASMVKRFSLLSFVVYLSLDSILMSLVFYFSPSMVPYIILLSKSFIASNLTSLRNRYILDAFASSTLLILLENSILYAIKHYELLRGDSLLSFSSTFTSSDFLYPLYYKTSSSITKTLLFYLSFHQIHENSILMFQMEFALQFLHSTLSIYIIMHNLNPILRKSTLINKTCTFFESFICPDPQVEESDHQQNDINPLFHNNINKSATQNVFQIPKEISSSNLPTLRATNITVNDKDGPFNNEDKDIVDPEADEAAHRENMSIATDTSESIPMWFPEDHQVLNMNDVSSSSFVVAQNFENFCKMIWSSSSTLNVTNTNTANLGMESSSPPSSTNILNSSYINPTQKNRSSGSPFKKPALKGKNSVLSDKKSKINVLKYQQPLWTFLNAVRTMFSRQDYYSGDYYSQNAVVPTGYGVDDYVGHDNFSSQCFIWFTGETTLAFELHNISLEQLLIKVNGIIWEHVSSCAFFGRELIIINGLSPLSQYDIDFVKITLHGDLVHLTTTTVSTVFQNKTVTESNISSPLSTLQRSVVTTQEAIEREKARLKKLKSDWRKKSSQLKAEIENLNNRSTFSDESRNYKKLDSLRQTVAKSDIEIANLSKRSEELRLLQTEIEEKYLDAKRLYETEVRSFSKFQNDCKNSTVEEEKKIESLRSEKSQLLVKKEKNISKKLRIHHDVELLSNELETLKKTEVALRVERRKFRSIQREEKYKLLVKDIKNFEKQLRAKSLNQF